MQQRPGIATEDNNTGTNETTSNPTMHPPNSQQTKLKPIHLSSDTPHSSRAALLPAVGTCVVLSFGAMPGRCCFLRVTQQQALLPYEHNAQRTVTRRRAKLIRGQDKVTKTVQKPDCTRPYEQITEVSSHARSTWISAHISRSVSECRSDVGPGCIRALMYVLVPS